MQFSHAILFLSLLFDGSWPDVTSTLSTSTPLQKTHFYVHDEDLAEELLLAARSSFWCWCYVSLSIEVVAFGHVFTSSFAIAATSTTGRAEVAWWRESSLASKSLIQLVVVHFFIKHGVFHSCMFCLLFFMQASFIHLSYKYLTPYLS